MPDNDELDSSTVSVEEKPPLTGKKNELLTGWLAQAEDFIKTLRTELDFEVSDYADYRKSTEYRLELKDKTIKLAQEWIDERDLIITELEQEKEGWENQANYLNKHLLKNTKQRDTYQEKLNQIVYCLEQERINNDQITYDNLNLLDERDILVKKYTIAKSKIQRRDKIITILSHQCLELKEYFHNSDDLLLEKNTQLNQLRQERDTFKEERDHFKAKIRRLRKKLEEESEEHEKENTELYTENQELKDKLGALALELGKERVKNQRLTKAKEIFIKSAKDYQWKYEFNKEKKERIIKKLQAIRKQQKLDAERAQRENVCQTLIKWQGIPNHYIRNDKLKEVITDTNNSFIDTVANAQKHLGVGNLTQIKTTHKLPDNKTLKDLIEFYWDNKNSVPPSQPQNNSEPERIFVETERVNETVIVSQIIQECDLGLNENSSLTQVIQKINRLIGRKPPIIETVNQPTDTPFGESLEKIIEIDLNSLEKELGINLSREVKEQIHKVSNYQELSSLRNREIKNYLEKGQNIGITSLPNQEVIRPQKERVFWIILLVVSLLTIGGLLVKLSKLRKKISNKSSF